MKNSPRPGSFTPPTTAMPTAPGAAAAAAASAAAESGSRKLVVGRGITFSGEIKSCDFLVVEGTVKANITGCEEVHIADGGLFSGSASVGNTEIRGNFEGELHVAGRLLICASGTVDARVRYHQIEIERGGRITGEIEADDAAGPGKALTLPLLA